MARVRSLSRGATVVEVLTIVALVALGAIGAFSAFGGAAKDTTVVFGRKLLNLEANHPVVSGPANPTGTGYVARSDGPTCDAIRGCGQVSAARSTTPTNAAPPAADPRIDGIIRRILLLPDDQRGAALAALPASDFAAVDARLGQLRGAFTTLKNANDPAYVAMAQASERYRTSQEGILPYLFNGGEIEASRAARAQALDALFARVATMNGTTTVSADASSGLFSEIWRITDSTRIAPAFTTVNNAGTWAFAGLAANITTAAERARTWEIQRARDAEAANARAFDEYLRTQPYAAQHEARDAERQFMADLVARLPPQVRRDFIHSFQPITVLVNGVPEVRLQPTPELRQLQDAQAALLGVEVDGLRWRRTLQFSAPTTGDEALRWWLTYGNLDPRSLASKWNPLDDSIRTADEVFGLMPITTGITVVRSLGTIAAREIFQMAATEVVINAAMLGTSEAIAEKYGPLAGTGSTVAMMMAMIVTHRIVRSPRLLAAAQRFGGCFVAGTRVVTDHGEIAIEDVHVGTRVLSRDADTKEISYEPVVETFVKYEKAIVRLSLDGENVGVTLEHPFWVEGRGFTPAEELAPGDIVSTASGATTVRALSLERETQTVYNFEVDRTHTYFVGHHAAWVHNICQPRQAQLVRKGTSEQQYTFQRQNFPDIEGRIVGDVTGEVSVMTDAANEVSAAVLLARETGGRVYLGKEAEMFIRRRAAANGQPYPPGRSAGRFPDVVVETPDGRLIVAEAKGFNINSAEGQLTNSVPRLGPNVEQRIYMSTNTSEFNEVGRGLIRGSDGYAYRIINEGELPPPGAVQMQLPLTSEQGRIVTRWIVRWEPNGLPVRIVTDAEIAPVLGSILPPP